MFQNQTSNFFQENSGESESCLTQNFLGSVYKTFYLFDAGQVSESLTLRLVTPA